MLYVLFKIVSYQSFRDKVVAGGHTKICPSLRESNLNSKLLLNVCRVFLIHSSIWYLFPSWEENLYFLDNTEFLTVGSFEKNGFMSEKCTSTSKMRFVFRGLSQLKAIKTPHLIWEFLFILLCILISMLKSKIFSKWKWSFFFRRFSFLQRLY